MRRISLLLVCFILVSNSLRGWGQGLKKGASESPVKHTVPLVPANQPAEVSDEFLIGRQDVLMVNVWKQPELSMKVVVRPDGKITLPLINDIQASGLTTRSLQEQIGQRLKEFVASPHVTVVVSEINSQVVYIVGQVAKPGIYPLASPMTVIQLLARAGSFTEFAKPKRIKIVRQEGNKTVQHHFNYNEFLDEKNLQQNIPLKNGDVVMVP